MLRRIVDYLFRNASGAKDSGKSDPTGLEDTAAKTLMRMCEEYWDSLGEPLFEEIEDLTERVDAMMAYLQSPEKTQRRDDYVRAIRELGKRGPETRDWARRCLAHSDYEAREQAAWWIAELAKRDQLGDAVEAVIDELRGLAHRPIEEDGKEMQAVGGALFALSEIDHPKAVAALRDILFSKHWDHDDRQWDAAEALGRMVGQQFHMRPDPVRTARQWLEDHPH